jgi:hypothetical protein
MIVFLYDFSYTYYFPSPDETWLCQRAFIIHIGHLRTRGEFALCLPPASSRPLLGQIMSQTHSIASSSSSNFQSIFNAALEAYEKKTKCKLLTHPLASRLQSCDSPTAILSVLQDLIQQFDRRRNGDERLSDWLNPTVNVLYVFSDFIGQGVGLVSLYLNVFL